MVEKNLIREQCLPVENALTWLQEMQRQHLSEAWLALIHCDHVVKFALVTDPLFQNFRYIRDVRLFSHAGEIYVWRREDGVFAGRLRLDDDNLSDVYEETHLLWGTKLKEANSFDCSILFEERGSEIEIPVDITEDCLPLKYKVRHYYSFDDIGQVRFFDARIVSVQDKYDNCLSRR